jgi:hypothetical protein
VVSSHGMEYNISKIQLKIMCRFCRNIDQEILHFYFSSKNCSSKVYTSLEKVVVLVTLSTTKLGLQSCYIDGARRGTVCSRGWEAAAFKACAGGVRRFAADRSKLRLGMGVGWPWYGEAWAATCYGRRASGERRRTWPLGRGRKGRFGANGSHRARTDGHWPVSACGPGGKTTAARRCAMHGVARNVRVWARSAPIEFRLAMFDCQKLKFSKHQWTK